MDKGQEDRRDNADARIFQFQIRAQHPRQGK